MFLLGLSDQNPLDRSHAVKLATAREVETRNSSEGPESNAHDKLF
jgi:hypothetical protein